MRAGMSGIVGERVQLSEQRGTALMRGLREARPERHPRGKSHVMRRSVSWRRARARCGGGSTASVAGGAELRCGGGGGEGERVRGDWAGAQAQRLLRDRHLLAGPGVWGQAEIYRAIKVRARSGRRV